MEQSSVQANQEAAAAAAGSGLEDGSGTSSNHNVAMSKLRGFLSNKSGPSTDSDEASTSNHSFESESMKRTFAETGLSSISDGESSYSGEWKRVCPNNSNTKSFEDRPIKPIAVSPSHALSNATNSCALKPAPTQSLGPTVLQSKQLPLPLPLLQQPQPQPQPQLQQLPQHFQQQQAGSEDLETSLARAVSFLQPTFPMFTTRFLGNCFSF